MDLLILVGILGTSYLFYTKLTAKSKNYPNRLRNVHINKGNLPEDFSNIKLSEEQNAFLEKLENSQEHFFITGKAGTGKSVLLQFFKSTSTKNIVICASTGVAALNVRGQTIHSLFKLPPNFINKEDLRPVDHRTQFLLQNIDTLVIDEISMVRADLMDAIDYRLKQARKNQLPFGGVQVVMFGDLFQLPPVVSDPEIHKYFSHNNGGFYFFNANIWKQGTFNILELNTIFRQRDNTFISILNEIRKGSIDDSLLKLLNEQVNKQPPAENVVTITTTNQAVKEINEYNLAKIQEKAFTYKAEVVGDLERTNFPTEELLTLKKGAQVMLLKNDKDHRWVNGTLATIYSLNENGIKINVGGYVYTIEPAVWNKIKYTYNHESRKIEEEIVSSFKQYPLRLAWAITVHKSQGHTYEGAIVDMGTGAFAHGQTYVALSRCKTLEKLYLTREILREDIIVDPEILNFSNHKEVEGK